MKFDNKNILDKIETTLSPRDVAVMLNIAYSKALALMKSNEIRSYVETEAINGKNFLKTVPSEISAYQQRLLNKRNNVNINSRIDTKNGKTAKLSSSSCQLSNLSMKEFLNQNMKGQYA